MALGRVGRLDWSTLVGGSRGDIETGAGGVGVEGGGANRGLADKQLGDCDHRDQSDH